MERFIQVIVDGIATGSIYAALALALVLIFRSTGVVNFAQGEMAMFSTFIAWGLYAGGVPLGLAVLTTLVLSFVAGMVIERGLIRHFEGGETLTLVIVTLGLFILLNSLAGWIWGFGNRSFPSMFGDSTFALGGVQLSVESVGIVAVLIGVVGVLFLLFQRTKIGLAMRAAALNPESSGLVGVRVGRMLMLGWGLAAALGALAGVLVAPRLFLDVNLGLAIAFPQLIKRFDGLTEGTQGLTVEQPTAPSWLPLADDQFLYLLTLLVAAVMFVAVWSLMRSQVGRAVQAVRDGEIPASTLGIDLASTKTRVFALSAGYAGVAGALYVFAIGFVAPEAFTVTISLAFLAAIVVGGLATIVGAVFGALFIEFVPDYASDVNDALTGVIYGGVLILFMYLLPDGAVGLLRRIGRLVARPPAAPAEAGRRPAVSPRGRGLPAGKA